MSTNRLSVKEIKRQWHIFDASDKILGRLASEVATILMGKNKAMYVPYLDTGDYVVVTNALKIKVTGKKMNQKTYFRHSGYPGGDKVETLKELMSKKPTEVLRHAVVGMLPKTKLGKKMIKKLYIYESGDHPFERQLGGAK